MLWLHTIRNALDYPIRRLLHWRRRGKRFRNEPKDRLFDHLTPEERPAAERTAARLLAQYHLDALYADSSCFNYQVNLFYLELLERALDELDVPLPDPLVAVDIGPSHWFYVQALYGLLRWWRAPAGREVVLRGFEIDPWRVYRDLYSRHDHAMAHIRAQPGVEYLTCGFRPEPNGYDLVLMPFPFVFIADHLRWGLPRALFDPPALLAGAWSSVRPGGVLVIVNQGEAEHRQQRAWLEAQEMPVRVAQRHDSLMFQHELPRFVIASAKG